METLTAAADFALSQHAQMSNLHGRAANEPLRVPNALHDQAVQPSASQDSIATAESDVSGTSSTTRSALRLQSGISDMSQISSNNTDLTSPSSTSSTDAKGTRLGRRVAGTQNRTPEEQSSIAYFESNGGITSPMSIASPPPNASGTNAAKRTASGHVKSVPTVTNTPYVTDGVTSPYEGQHKRRDSTSSSGSRTSELAASLRNRLSYAMAKVQHGWEHKSLREVEQMATKKASHHRHRHSVSLVPPSTGVRSPGVTYQPPPFYERDQMDVSSISPPRSTKRHSAGFYPSSSQHRRGLSLGQHQPMQLQPPADIRPSSSHRAYRPHSLAGSPPLYHPRPRPEYSAKISSMTKTSMSPPQTPLPRQPAKRPSTIRTETQTAEAERDALQALFQLGSPRTVALSGNPDMAFSPPSSQQYQTSQTSPLRANFLPPTTP